MAMDTLAVIAEADDKAKIFNPGSSDDTLKIPSLPL